MRRNKRTIIAAIGVGALVLCGAAAFTNTITDSTPTNAPAAYGAIHASGATVTLTDLAVVDGTSPAHAGAVENSGTLTLIDDLISRNRAADPGGAIVNYGTITSMVGDRFVGGQHELFHDLMADVVLAEMSAVDLSPTPSG